MKLANHERFISGNQELREILRRAEGLENSDDRVTEDDVKAIGDRLLNTAPEVGDAARSETLDTCLMDELAEYVKNLRALQQTIEKVRSAPADRRVSSEPGRHDLDDSPSWVHAFLETT